MRRFVVFLSLLVCFTACYAVGSYLRSYPLAPREASFSAPLPGGSNPGMVTKTANAIQSNQSNGEGNGPAATNAQPAVNPAAALEREKGPALIEAFQQSVPQFPYRDLHEALRRRFENDYPKLESEREKEAASRIGVLEALGGYRERMMSRTEQQQLSSFLESVVSNPAENPGVQATAGRVLLQNCAQQEEEECHAVFDRLPSRVIAQASRTKVEILESLFRAKDSQ